MGKFQDTLNRRLIITDKAHYHREQYQSYMTGPEWRNVEMAEEFAQFLRDGHSMFQFPWLRQTLDLWKVFFRSWSAAKKYNGFFEILFSEYMVMDLFVASFTSLEFTGKGLVSLLLYPFLKRENSSEMQNYLTDYHARYAAKLQTVPFYDHEYASEHKALNEAYRKCIHKTWVDWFSCSFISLELLARHWISKPLRYWFKQEDNLAAPTTDILVKFKTTCAKDENAAKQEFLNILNEEKNEINAHPVGNDIYIKKPNTAKGKTHYSVHARLSVPRYAAFQKTLRNMGSHGIELRKIAGQNNVQVKCSINNADSREEIQHLADTLSKAAGAAHPLYTYGDRIHANHRVCLFDVPVKNLHRQLEKFDACGNHTKVEFIHNF